MPNPITKVRRTSVTVLSGELASLASGTLSSPSGASGSTVFDNTANGDPEARIFFDLTFASAPAANSAVYLHITASEDGTGYDNNLVNSSEVVILVGLDLQVSNKFSRYIGNLGPFRYKFSLRHDAGILLSSGTVKAAGVYWQYGP